MPSSRLHADWIVDSPTLPIIVFRRCESSRRKYQNVQSAEVDIAVARAHRDVPFSTAAQVSCEFLGNTSSFRKLHFDFGYFRLFLSFASVRIGIRIVIADRLRQICQTVNCSLRKRRTLERMKYSFSGYRTRGWDISQWWDSFRLIRRKGNTSRDDKTRAVRSCRVPTR